MKGPAGGFSLIEALVTLLVLSIGLLGLGQLQVRLWHAGGELYATEAAFLWGTSVLESVTAAGPAGTGTAGGAGTPGDRPPGMELVEYATVTSPEGLAVTRVALRWQAPSGQQALRLTVRCNTKLDPKDTRWLLPPL